MLGEKQAVIMKYIKRIVPALNAVLVFIISLTVIYGLLSIFMASSGREPTNASRATDTIVNMSTLKGAALFVYIASMDMYSSVPEAVPAKDDLLKYISADFPISESTEQAKEGDYFITSLNGGKAWYVGYKFRNNEDDEQIKPLLAKRAESLGLLEKDMITSYNNGPEVYMFILYNAEHNSHREQ